MQGNGSGPDGDVDGACHGPRRRGVVARDEADLDAGALAGGHGLGGGSARQVPQGHEAGQVQPGHVSGECG